MPKKTDKAVNENLMDGQRESEEPLETEEAEASLIEEQQPRRSQRMQHVPGRFEPPAAPVSAYSEKPNSWYQGLDGIDAQNMSHAMYAKYNLLFENETRAALSALWIKTL